MLDSLADLQLALDGLAHVTHMVEEKLVEGTSGNISARAAERGAMIITPGSYPYQNMTIGDLLKVDVNTLSVLRGFRPVSPEKMVHGLNWPRARGAPR
jgi:ribulose-5-phosphate 4-epimerase/fuculose-1-phosphate aldolase